MKPTATTRVPWMEDVALGVCGGGALWLMFHVHFGGILILVGAPIGCHLGNRVRERHQHHSLPGGRGCLGVGAHGHFLGD